MAKEDQIVAALGAVKSSMRHINRRSMRLGRYIGGVLEERVNNDLPANYVWVFDPQGDKRVSSPAKNLKTEYGKGLAVIVAFNIDTLEDDVIDVDTVLAPLEQGSAAAGLNSPQKPASLSTPVSARDITVGGVFADSGGGLNVRIGAYWHENGYYADSTALALTPTVTSNRKSLAVVGVNRLTNAATYTLTADRGLAYTLIANGAPLKDAVTDIMAVVDANPHIDWRGAVELKNGDTEVNPAKIIPLNWLKPAMVGADGSTAGERGLVPAPAATDNDKVLLGAGTWTFRHLTSTTSTTVTISGGAATIPATTCFIVLAAESGTADDLDTATVTGSPRIILFQADSGDTITIKHNTGNIKFNSSADFLLSGDKTIALFWDGTNIADLGAGSSSFSGDAFDVPYTATTPANWSVAPTNAGEAFDTLAADVVALGGGGGNPQPDQWVNTTSESKSGTSYSAYTNSAEGTFTAPPTGKIYVTVSGRLNLGNTQNYGYTSWELREGSTIGSGTVTVAADDNRAVRAGNTVTTSAPFYGQGSHRYLVTGLVAGDTYNIRTMHRSSVSLSSEFRSLLVEPVL